MKKTLGRRNLERKEPQLRSGRWLSFYFSVRLFLLSFFFLFYFILSSFLRYPSFFILFICPLSSTTLRDQG